MGNSNAYNYNSMQSYNPNITSLVGNTNQEIPESQRDFYESLNYSKFQQQEDMVDPYSNSLQKVSKNLH